ncbi:GGDEF domain-containing protein [Alteromonas sp. ASW11-36]|uniref:diguanylate cyclase n=1 Tax=Alteromonas arenosi TaxID=3055817 RepID=A0ABT7SV96_9ALTE|nr:GGDEF domain-containing protein [Alteromonas sp. ASW11-36]MDM7859924.1 GGDEF domain-containing protein [Alteromonas sp. ASW11-36]
MFALLGQLARRYAKAGCSDHFDEDTNRRVVVVNLFVFIGGGITLVLGIRAIMGDDNHLAISLFIASLLFFSTRWLQILKPTRFYQTVSSTILQCCLMVLTLYLVIAGGNNNTGPLWIYLVPPVCMFLGGFKYGLIANLIYTAILAIILFAPSEMLLLTSYSFEFKTRLLYSFMTIIFLSAFYEYSREQSYSAVGQLRDEFERQALHDQLTKLPNRRNLNEQLKHEYQRTLREKEPFSLLLADVDFFKRINDDFGHDAGDEVLLILAQRFKQAVRNQDLVSRWGGEEFLFLLPQTSLQQAAEVAEKVRLQTVNEPVWQNQRPIPVTISIGVAEVNPNTSIDDAINLADKRLYIAKQDGRNRVIWQ